MTYVLAGPLQEAVFGRLTSDAALGALVGAAIHDAVPPVDPADAPDVQVVLGEERVRDWSTATSDGAAHEFTVTVHARTEGFKRAKEAAAAVCEALLGAPLSLTRGAVVNLRFMFARADRGPASRPRTIALRFRAVLEDV